MNLVVQVQFRKSDRPAQTMETRIAVLIPCCNEEATIGKVVREFAAALAGPVIYVYDNNSTDRTIDAAKQAGAVVRSEHHQGKGHVVCRMFADIDADVYLLVDGDGTYDAASAPMMIERLLKESLDLVNGARAHGSSEAYRTGHHLGNRIFTGLVAKIFGDRFSDMLSGYKVFSRRFVKSFPALAEGFEIETALTIHALRLRMPTAEIQTPYRERPSGSTSKLRTFRDGLRIFLAILRLEEEERPLQLFGTISLMLAAVSIVFGYPVIATYFETGLVPRFPTAVLAASLMVLAWLCLAAGLIIDMVTLGRLEAKRLSYLSVSAPEGNAD